MTNEIPSYRSGRPSPGPYTAPGRSQPVEPYPSVDYLSPAYAQDYLDDSGAYDSDGYAPWLHTAIQDGYLDWTAAAPPAPVAAQNTGPITSYDIVNSQSFRLPENLREPVPIQSVREEGKVELPALGVYAAPADSGPAVSPAAPEPDSIKAQSKVKKFITWLTSTDDDADVIEIARPFRKKKHLTRLNKLGNFTVSAVCLLIVAGSILFAVSKNPEKSIFGFHFYTVLTDSMTPTEQTDGTTPIGGFLRGDAIVVREIRPEDVKVGDIITFRTNPVTKDGEVSVSLTHRVVAVREDLSNQLGRCFVTKGDHNQSEDPPISEDALIGKKIFTIRRLGKVLKVAREHRFLTAILCSSLLLCSLLMARPLSWLRKEENETLHETVQRCWCAVFRKRNKESAASAAP
ncbi:MAG: signal peptidase I [Oscillospiraceae bacterium]|nr:signal peptidase I [Oscillospiraceae bacterium]